MLRRIISVASSEFTKILNHRLLYLLIALAILIPFTVPLVVNIQVGFAAMGDGYFEMPSGHVAFLDAVSFSMTLIIPLLLIYAALSVTAETEHGMLKVILVRPIRRFELLMGKLLALWVLTASLLILAGLFSYISSSFFFEWKDVFASEETDSERVLEKTQLLANRMRWMFPLLMFALLSYVTVAFSISTMVAKSGTSVGLTMIFFFLGPIVVNFAPIELSEAMNSFLLNFYCNAPLEWASDAAENLFNIKLRAENIILAVIVPLAYAFVFTIVSAAIFQRRHIKTS